MKEEDIELLKRMREVEDFTALCEVLNNGGFDFNELYLARQYEMIHSPFAVIESEH